MLFNLVQQAEWNNLCRKYPKMNKKVLRAQFENDIKQQEIATRNAWKDMGGEPTQSNVK